jgi:hypothetical protein
MLTVMAEMWQFYTSRNRVADFVSECVSVMQIQRAVSNRMEVNMKLEQDEMEGVDEREWVSSVVEPT